MKERPILFSGPMVRAIMDGRKTMTRRAIRNPSRLDNLMMAGEAAEWCPYGQPGDLLWVRETWAEYMGHPVYRADGDRSFNDGRGLLAIGPWRPSIHMPRWASRLTLRLTDVRVERVQEISIKDVLREGVEYDLSISAGGPFARFEKLWDSLNAKRGYSWKSNPYVWVLEFERV